MKPPSQPPPPQPLSTVVVDEPDDPTDAPLSKSNLLTRQEVLRRRMNRLRKLAKCYRDYYWELMEEVREKHREYVWIYGRSPYVEEDGDECGAGEERENGCYNGGCYENGGNSNGVSEKLGFGKSVSWCEYQGCAAKAMALTRFCVDHILLDPKQMLYKACKFPHRSEDWSLGSLLCNRPILKSVTPSLCPLHERNVKRKLGQALRKGGVGNHLSSKVVTKFNFHLVISEYVQLIQSRRRDVASRNPHSFAVANGST